MTREEREDLAFKRTLQTMAVIVVLMVVGVMFPSIGMAMILIVFSLFALGGIAAIVFHLWDDFLRNRQHRP